MPEYFSWNYSATTTYFEILAERFAVHGKPSSLVVRQMNSFSMDAFFEYAILPDQVIDHLLLVSMSRPENETKRNSKVKTLFLEGRIFPFS